MANCKTTIRMGAAHYDLDMRVGTISSRVNLAEVLHGLPPRERNSRLSGIAEIICKAHGIALRHPPAPAPIKATGKRARKTPPMANYLIQSAAVTKEATL